MRQGRLILAAGHVRSKKKTREKKRNPAAPKTHHEIYSSPATATTSRRRVTKHIPRVSPYSPASIDPGFVEIGLVQLLQSVKTTNSMLHTSTHTDRLIKYWHPVRTPVLVERYMRQEAASCLRQAVCVRRKKNRRKKKHEKIRPPIQNTPRNPQQPGDRVQLETACEETRHTH